MLTNMPVYSMLTNPVRLKTIKECKLFKLNLTLKDDLWNKEILLLKSGKNLTEDIIDKLLNIGILEVNIIVNENNFTKEEHDSINNLKNNFTNKQTVFIFSKKLREASFIVKELINFAFKKNNLFVISDNKNLIKYFKIKNPSYIFLDNDFYNENSKILHHILLQRKNSHLILLKNKISYQSKTIEHLKPKMLENPIQNLHLKQTIRECVDNDFDILLKNNINL